MTSVIDVQPRDLDTWAVLKSQSVNQRLSNALPVISGAALSQVAVGGKVGSMGRRLFHHRLLPQNMVTTLLGGSQFKQAGRTSSAIRIDSGEQRISAARTLA